MWESMQRANKTINTKVGVSESPPQVNFVLRMNILILIIHLLLHYTLITFINYEI